MPGWTFAGQAGIDSDVTSWGTWNALKDRKSPFFRAATAENSGSFTQLVVTDAGTFDITFENVAQLANFSAPILGQHQQRTHRNNHADLDRVRVLHNA